MCYSKINMNSLILLISITVTLITGCYNPRYETSKIEDFNAGFRERDLSKDYDENIILRYINDNQNPETLPPKGGNEKSVSARPSSKAEALVKKIYLYACKKKTKLMHEEWMKLLSLPNKEIDTGQNEENGRRIYLQYLWVSPEKELQDSKNEIKKFLDKLLESPNVSPEEKAGLIFKFGLPCFFSENPSPFESLYEYSMWLKDHRKKMGENVFESLKKETESFFSPKWADVEDSLYLECQMKNHDIKPCSVNKDAEPYLKIFMWIKWLLYKNFTLEYSDYESFIKERDLSPLSKEKLKPILENLLDVDGTEEALKLLQKEGWNECQKYIQKVFGSKGGN